MNRDDFSGCYDEESGGGELLYLIQDIMGYGSQI